QCPALKAYRQQQGEFTAPLLNVPQYHYAESHTPEQQAQSAEGLKGAQIRVLDRIECIQTIRCSGQLQPGILQCLGQGGGDFRRLVGGGVHQKKPIATDIREASDEFRFVNDQVALQNGVGERAHQPQLEWTSFSIHIIHGVADLFSQRPENGVLVSNGGNFIRRISARIVRLFKEQPVLFGIGSLGNLRERERSPIVQSLGVDAQ